MTFVLGARSRKELQGVHPDLVRVVERAIALTAVDFAVHDGLRSLEDQVRLVDSGASRTMDSRHLLQPDGFGHAVDLVPWINGRLRWEWQPIFRVAMAMQVAALDEEVHVRWGGCWELLHEIGDPGDAVYAYVGRRALKGKRYFADGPHFEIALE